MKFQKFGMIFIVKFSLSNFQFWLLHWNSWVQKVKAIMFINSSVCVYINHNAIVSERGVLAILVCIGKKKLQHIQILRHIVQRHYIIVTLQIH